MLDDLRDREDRAVEAGDLIVFGEKDMCPSSASSLGFIVKTGVRVCCEDHFAGAVHCAVIGIRGEIVEELMDGILGILGRLGLTGTDGIEPD